MSDAEGPCEGTLYKRGLICSIALLMKQYETVGLIIPCANVKLSAVSPVFDSHPYVPRLRALEQWD